MTIKSVLSPHLLQRWIDPGGSSRAGSHLNRPTSCDLTGRYRPFLHFLQQSGFFCTAYPSPLADPGHVLSVSANRSPTDLPRSRCLVTIKGMGGALSVGSPPTLARNFNSPLLRLQGESSSLFWCRVVVHWPPLLNPMVRSQRKVGKPQSSWPAGLIRSLASGQTGHFRSTWLASCL